MAETVGSLADKISILELKLFYMKAQTQRRDASEKHKTACRRRWRILKRQRDDLAAELNQLLTSLRRGTTRLRTYRQFKMYNDSAYRTGQ